MIFFPFPMSSDTPEPTPNMPPTPEGQREELARLQAEHERLQGELETMQTRLSDLSSRLETLSKPKPRKVRPRKRQAVTPTDDEALHAQVATAPETPTVKEPSPEPAEISPPEPEPKAQAEPQAAPTPADLGTTLTRAKSSTPPPIPSTEESVVVEETKKPAPPPLPEEAQTTTTSMESMDSESVPTQDSATNSGLDEDDTVETRWGVYLLRIGVVLFLLSLAFAGNYAYQEWFVHLTAGTKVTLLYVLCALVLGLGKWMESFASGVQQFGSGLGAAGLAGLYYVTFAAHYTERLRVIESPILAGVLLLAWAGFVFYLAERRSSQWLALVAVALAYFSTAIGPAGWFAAGANVLLAVVSVLLQLRHRWTSLGALSLIGVYLSFLCQSILGLSLVSGRDPLAAIAADPHHALIVGLIALTAYWITFATASFYARPEIQPPLQRTLLLTLNNALWIGLGWLLLVRLDFAHVIGEALLAAGTLLLIAAVKARWLVAAARPTVPAYTAQGLAVFTVGLMLTFTGTTQALLLGTELLLVLFTATSTGNRILRYASLVLAPCVTGTALYALELGQISAPAALGTAAILLFSGWWAKFHHRETSWRQEQVDWFSANGLGLLTCSLVMLYHGDQRLLLLSVEFAVVLLFAVGSTSYLLRVATHLLGAIVLAVAGGLILLGTVTWVMGLSVALLFWGAWWAQHQTLAINKWTPADIGWLSALALALGYQWLHEVIPPEVIWPLLGAITLGLSVTTRWHQIPTLTYLSQLYFLLACTNLAGPLLAYSKDPALAPAWWQPAALIVIGLMLSTWWQRTRVLRNEDFSLAMRLIDAAAVVSLFYLWLEPRVDANTWMLLASGLTLGLSAYGLWRREWLLATLAQGLVLAAVLELFLRAGSGINWPAALFPTATMIGLALAAETLLPRALSKLSDPVSEAYRAWVAVIHYAASLYRIVAVFLGVRLINTYVPDAERGWVFALLGFAILATNGWRMQNLRFLGAALYFIIALGRWMNPFDPSSALHWPNWLGLGLILLAPVLTRRVRAQLPLLTTGANGSRQERRDWERIAIFCLRLFAVFALWVQASRLIDAQLGTSYLTIAWALTALVVLGGGFLVRERLLRWFGLIILALSLLRFGAIDLWGFDTLYRLVSASALTLVVLLLAFLYSKYAGKPKR